MIQEITFDEIKPYWSRLWETREEFPPHSNMLHLGGYFGLDFIPEATYFAYVVDGNIAGVNSGHSDTQNFYRSRGLWVNPEYRGKGYGVELLRATINKSRDLGLHGCWSYPRYTSWKTYAAAGFELTSDWVEANGIKNAYCFLKNH